MCKCFQGYVGADCSLFDCSLKDQCSGQGNCTAINQCTCFTGFKGDTCSEKDCSVRNDCGNRSSQIGLGVGLGLGFFFLILLALLLLFFFVFKKKGDNKDPNIKKPNFQALVFPPGYQRKHDVSGFDNNLALLKENLLKHLGLVNLITPTIKKKEDFGTIPRALAHIFQNNARLPDLFENWVTLELVAAKSKGTLFRLNSCATAFFSTYIQLNCLYYLWWVNATLIHTLNNKAIDEEEGRIKSTKNFEHTMEEEMINLDVATTELDPQNLGEVDELYLRANSYQLLLYLTQLERRIVSSTKIMPPHLKRLFLILFFYLFFIFIYYFIILLIFINYIISFY